MNIEKIAEVIQIIKLEDKYQMTTNKDYSDFIKKKSIRAKEKEKFKPSHFRDFNYNSLQTANNKS